MDIPDLTFPEFTYGKVAVPKDLRILLYRGGAGTHAKKVFRLITEGDLGQPVEARVSLVVKLYEGIRGVLAGGGSPETAITQIEVLRALYRHADRMKADLTEASAKGIYVDWIAYQHHRQRLKLIKAQNVYSTGVLVSVLLAAALDLPPKALRRAARLQAPKKPRRVLGVAADKQNLADTMAFGHAMLDITEGIPAEAINGPLPVRIQFRTGQIIEEWSGLIPTGNLKTYTAPQSPAVRRYRVARRELAMTDTSLHARFPLANLRMEAEMLIFIAQTGMNLAQVVAIKMGKFSYQSYHDGYAVRRIYKGRRLGEVEFEIYSEYRVVFERYLDWRAALFPEDPDGLLFPFIAAPGKSGRQHHAFIRIHKKCTALGIAYICPRMLRSTRINWLLRRSKDPDLTAEMAQHTRQTLLGIYEKPSYQVTMVEATNYFHQADPSITPPGPGACVEQQPEPLPNIPFSAPQPDCISPAGCLFCVHQRDIDSLDHVWSLTSYRYLKTLERARQKPISKSDVESHVATVIQRVTDKLRAIEGSSATRGEWAKEAQARVDEGQHHPHWDGFIQLAEIGA
jgi:hypothetical protein